VLKNKHYIEILYIKKKKKKNKIKIINIFWKMQLKNLQIILIFVTYVSLVLSSPIIDDSEIPTESIQELEATEEFNIINDNFRVTEFRGDDKIDDVLAVGGFDNDTDLVRFVLNKMGYQNVTDIYFNNTGMACSAFQVPNEDGNGYYFGRNFDWYDSNAAILINHPDNGYSSISTVNPDFINWLAEGLSFEDLLNKIYTQPNSIVKIPDDILRVASVFAPLDGLNEKGLSISINMVYSNPVNQTTPGLTDLTVLPLIRVLLDKAANVDEALEIIKNVNLHNSLGLDFHYLIADASGKCVTVEYVNSQLAVTETKVITNFYLSQEDEDIGKDRYDIILEMMNKYPKMSFENAKETAMSASKYNTQWTVIYDQVNLEATYYRQLNFEQGYHIKLFDDLFTVEDDVKTVVVSDTENLEYEEDSNSDDETETETI